MLVDTLGLLLHAIIHPADIQDRDGGILLLATLFGMYPFLKKLFNCRWWLPGAGLSKGLGEDLAFSSKLKSSSAPIGRKDSWSTPLGRRTHLCLAQPLPKACQGLGEQIATRWRSCGLPQSASCSENFVIPPDVFGQTLSSQNGGG